MTSGELLLENTVSAMNTNPSSIMAWLGPAIGPDSFEVGDEVRADFCQKPGMERAFRFHRNIRDKAHWLADIYQIARNRLQAAGVEEIYGGDFCTLKQSDTFYSYRKNPVTGRFASLIWIDQSS